MPGAKLVTGLSEQLGNHEIAHQDNYNKTYWKVSLLQFLYSLVKALSFESVLIRRLRSEGPCVRPSALCLIYLRKTPNGVKGFHTPFFLGGGRRQTLI